MPNHKAAENQTRVFLNRKIRSNVRYRSLENDEQKRLCAEPEEASCENF